MPLSAPESTTGFIRGPDDAVRVPKWFDKADSRGTALENAIATMTVTRR